MEISIYPSHESQHWGFRKDIPISCHNQGFLQGLPGCSPGWPCLTSAASSFPGTQWDRGRSCCCFALGCDPTVTCQVAVHCKPCPWSPALQETRQSCSEFSTKNNRKFSICCALEQQLHGHGQGRAGEGWRICTEPSSTWGIKPHRWGSAELPKQRVQAGPCGTHSPGATRALHLLAQPHPTPATPHDSNPPTQLCQSPS